MYLITQFVLQHFFWLNFNTPQKLPAHANFSTVKPFFDQTISFVRSLDLEFSKNVQKNVFFFFWLSKIHKFWKTLNMRSLKVFHWDFFSQFQKVLNTTKEICLHASELITCFFGSSSREISGSPVPRSGRR